VTQSYEEFLKTQGLPTGIEKLYTISYMWYYALALLVAIAVAFIVSWITGFRKGIPVDLSLSVRCCYKHVDERLVDDEQYPVYPEKSQPNGSHINPAFSTGIPLTSRDDDDEKIVEPTGPGAQFEDFDDTGTYGYGIFNRNRCSRCRMSRVMHCTRL